MRTIKAEYFAETGDEKTFANAHVCPYDDSHDAAEVPADVCAIAGFGEGSLLLTMKRRLVEKLSIYTYVGDIVMCLNPYMYLPEMVSIAEYPNQTVRRSGRRPRLPRRSPAPP